MSDSGTVSVNCSGISFSGLLTILFIGLKLGAVIQWSWLWVLSPLWIPLALGLSIFTLVFVGGGIFLALAAIVAAIASALEK